MKDAARLYMHLPPYGPIMECGSHLAHRKPSGFFPLPFSPSKQKRCQPGQHLLPTEPSSEQGTPEAQLLLQMCPQSEQDRQLGRHIPYTARELRMCCQEPAGKCNHSNPAHGAGVTLWQLFYYFKEETLSCSHIWFIPAQKWAQEFEQ